MKRVLVAGLILALASSVRAELPAAAYAQMQREAPEAVTIHVLSVACVETMHPVAVDVAVTVLARVTAVERTASCLKPGALIRITYTHRRQAVPPPGPGEVPILEVWKTYPAFLERRGEAFRPAARSHSFSAAESPRAPAPRKDA
jgi:hypothetical protein